MTDRLRWFGLTIWTVFGLGLIWILIAALDVSFTDIFQALVDTPIWVFLIVLALTFANQLIGTLKWQVSARYLARPTDGLGFWRLVAMTNLGSLFGQLIPVQLSTLLVRWFFLDRNARLSGQVFGATFFEQTFDLILVLGGASAAVAVFGFGLAPAPAFFTLVAIVGFTLIALRPLLRLCANVFQKVQAISGVEKGLAVAEAGFERAAAAPAGVLLKLAAYSLARLITVGLRAVVIMIAFAPEIAGWLVFIASPAISLLTAIPITPAGLGVAEWSWSAVLVSGGTPAAAAAIAALNLRLVSAAMLFLIALVLGAINRLSLGNASR